MSGRATTVVSVVVTLAVLGGLWAWSAQRRQDRLDFGEGDLKHAFLVAGASPVLMAVETLDFSSEDSDETVYRVTTYDARTGKRIARKKEVSWRNCAPASEGLAWCYGENEALEVVTVPQLDTKYDAVTLSAKLGQKIMNVAQLDVSDSGALRATMADGKKVELDAATLSTRPQTNDSRSKSRKGTKLFDCSIPNSEREGLCTRGQYGAEQRVDTGDGWIRMDTLTDVPGGMFIVANTSLDESVNQRRVIRLDESFKEIGATTLGKMTGYASYEPLWVTPDELFLLVVGDLESTVAIDARTGSEAFRIRH